MAIRQIIRIPREFRIKDTGINKEVFIFEKPIIANPISSGSGDATTNAPIKGTIHLKSLNLKIEKNLSDPVFLIK